MTDIHAHIIFGLDDGARTPEESVSMLEAAQSAGVTAIVATPHVRSPRFDRGLARERLARLQRHTRIELRLGYEVHANILAQYGLEYIMRFRTERSDAFLLELDTHSFPPRLERIIYRLQEMGLTVRIAHPERYIPVQRDIAVAQSLFDSGCELQVDAASLAARPLSAAAVCARRLMKKRVVRWIASDAHRTEDYAVFRKAYARWSADLAG